MKRLLILFLIVSVMALASVASAQEPATQPVDYSAEAYRLVGTNDEIVSVLNSGITVIVKRVQSPVVSVRAYAHTGGIYEGKWLGGGLSHLLEHLVAGGTNERRSENENRNLLQKIGNNSNAYTTYDHTCYFVNTTTEHLDEAADLVAGWMLGAKITPAEYAREYQVVQRELEMNKGEPDRVFFLLAQNNRYRVSPARIPVIGFQEVIQGLSRDDVYSYYQLAYQPGNLIFAVAGNIEPQRMLDAIRKNVATAKPGRVFSHEIPAEPPVTAPRTVVATFPKLGQAKLQLGFPSVKLDDPAMYPLDVLATVMGWGESSILVEEVRDKRQLVSGISVGDWTPHYVDGTFAISMELNADKIDEATAAVLEQVERVRNELLPAERIERAKTQLRTSRLRSMQTSEDIIGSLATDFMSTGDPHFSDRYVERVQHVTAEQIRDAARQYLDRSRLLTTALVPAEAVGSEGLPKAEDVLRPIAPTTQASPEPASERITRVELENGVILLHKRITTTPLVDVRMYSMGGLTAEDEKTNGLGNLTMEMVSRGTRTRSAQQIAEFFDSIGGTFETDCGNNSWYWSMSCLKDDLPKALEVYADVINNPAFPENEITPVKQRVLAAIDSQDADWYEQAVRFFRQSYFGPAKSPYQFMALGQRPVVEAATTEQMRQWYSQKILNNRRVLAIFGDVDLKTAQSLAGQYLGSGGKLANTAPPTTQATEPLTPAEGAAAVNVAAVHVQQTAQPLAGVVIGFKSDSVIGRPSNFPLAVVDTMTSGYGYPTGYLHEILRGRGLVYVVHAINFPGRSSELPGTFMIYAGCDPRNANEVVDVILENIARTQGSNQEMNADWFTRSKQLITTGEAMQNETPAQQATTAALDELYGLGYNYHDQFAARIDAVTIDQVRQISRGRLREAVVTVSTPLPDLVQRKTGLREYKTFPEVDLTPRGVQHDTGQ